MAVALLEGKRLKETQPVLISKKIFKIFFCSCGVQAIPVVAYGLSCPAACGILVPGPGIEPVSPAFAGGFLTTGPSGKSTVEIFG